MSEVLNVPVKLPVVRIESSFYRAQCYVNNVWVSDGFSSSNSKAVVVAANNALIYLTREKGFDVVPLEILLSENIVRVDSKTLSDGTNNEFEKIVDKIRVILLDFVKNPNVARIEFSLDNISDEVRSEVHAISRTLKLGHRNEGVWPNKRTCSWKTSHILHNLADVYLNFNDLAKRRVRIFSFKFYEHLITSLITWAQIF